MIQSVVLNTASLKWALLFTFFMHLFALLICQSVFVSVRQADRLYYSYKFHTIQLWNENILTCWVRGAKGRAEERWRNSLPVCVDLVRMSHNGGNQMGKTEECTARRIVKMGRKTQDKFILTVEGSDWEGRRKRGVRRGKRGGQGRERKEGGAARGRSHMGLLHCSISSVSKSLSLPPSLHLPLWTAESAGPSIKLFLCVSVWADMCMHRSHWMCVCVSVTDICLNMMASCVYRSLCSYDIDVAQLAWFSHCWHYTHCRRVCVCNVCALRVCEQEAGAMQHHMMVNCA